MILSDANYTRTYLLSLLLLRPVLPECDDEDALDELLEPPRVERGAGAVHEAADAVLLSLRGHLHTHT